MQETWVWSLGQEDPLEKEMATHSSIPAWRIPWTEEPGGLQSTGLRRVRYDWTTNTFTSFPLKNAYAYMTWLSRERGCPLATTEPFPDLGHPVPAVLYPCWVFLLRIPLHCSPKEQNLGTLWAKSRWSRDAIIFSACPCSHCLGGGHLYLPQAPEGKFISFSSGWNELPCRL